MNYRPGPGPRATVSYNKPWYWGEDEEGNPVGYKVDKVTPHSDDPSLRLVYVDGSPDPFTVFEWEAPEGQTVPPPHIVEATRNSHRNQVQEMKYNQALGYAWGRQDGSGWNPGDIVDSLAFAHWYAANERGPLHDAFLEFRGYSKDAQHALGRKHSKMPFIPSADPPF